MGDTPGRSTRLRSTDPIGGPRLRTARWLSGLLLLAGGLLGGVPLIAREDPEASTPSNLTIYRRMAAAMIDTLVAPVAEAPEGPLRLQVYPAETAWAFELDIAQALQRATGRSMADAGSEAMAIEAAIVRGIVEYSGVRRDGIFGPRIADRTIYLEMRLKAWNPSTGATVFAGDVSEIARDTIRVAQIEDLDTPGLEMTTGAPPAEGVFTSLLEPLILIGAVAVGFYLLFTVRS